MSNSDDCPESTASDAVRDAYRRFGRTRARLHRDTIEAAVGRLVGAVAGHGVDRDAVHERALAVESSIPPRYRAELEGMAAMLSVPESDLRSYMFGTAAFQEALAPGGAPDPAEHGEGCTNLLVPARRSATGSPLVLKNRDITSRGFRPQVVLEMPPLGPFNGFLTTTTAGNVFVYQGVNSAGLAAANTFVDNRVEGIPASERLRNGVIVRDVLERCDSVDEAVEHVQSLPTAHSRGLSLFLADAETVELLEIDPKGGRVERVAEGVVGRTNHFPNGESSGASLGGGEEPTNEGTAASKESAESNSFADGDASSRLRRRRIDELAASLPESVSVRDLNRIARDHRHGPGPNSICRHPTADADTHGVTESTTVSSAVFVGGDGEMHAVHGNPCKRRPATYRLQHDSLEALEERAKIVDD